MKYSTIIFLLCLSFGKLGCDESFNPVGIEKQRVTVYLRLAMNTYPTKIYCEGQIVSFLQYRYEKDTIKVPDESELKARIYHNQKFTYKTIIAREGFEWKLP